METMDYNDLETSAPLQDTELTALDDRKPEEKAPTPEATAKKPDPEVAEKTDKRIFTPEYKARILAEADACTEPGQLGALLRKEGLYHSQLGKWRKKRTEGELASLTPKKPGPKAEPPNPLEKVVKQLERENDRLRAKLKTAETIIDVQKKVSGLLGIVPPDQESEGSS
jgi:transposase